MADRTVCERGTRDSKRVVSLDSRPIGAVRESTARDRSKANSIEDTDAAQRQSLKSVADPKLKARFTAIFDAALNPDRDRVVKKYELALQTKGHLEQGKGLFAKNCAACHRIDGSRLLRWSRYIGCSRSDL